MFKKILIFFIILSCFNSVFAVDIKAKYGILVDYDTGEILFSRNIKDLSAPSSTTKIMTAYIIFDMLEQGKFTLNDKFKVSVRAWRQEGTRMFLEPEWKISVDELLNGLIVVSGNDAAITLAEGSAGTIEDFVNLMNIKAKELGMNNTNFVNPNGLYDKSHFMSVEDLAILSRALIKNHYKYYKKYFSKTSYTFNNIRQRNRNWLLTEYKGADGLKTGFTDYGKYSISASVFRNGKRFIAVINGASSERERINDAKKLFDYGFSLYNYVDLFNSGDIVGEVNVIFGKDKTVPVYTKEDINYSTKIEDINNIKVEFVSNKYIQAPIKKDDIVAKIRITDKERITEYNLYASNDVEQTGKFKKFKSLFLYNCKKIIGFN